MSALSPGLKGEARLVVTAADFAIALGSGDVEVLGTPRMIALAEVASVQAIAGALDPGMTSVGTRVDIEHLAASPEGRSVTARAVLSAIDGRALRFEIEVSDDFGLVARGQIDRVIVDRAKFAERAANPR